MNPRDVVAEAKEMMRKNEAEEAKNEKKAQSAGGKSSKAAPGKTTKGSKGARKGRAGAGAKKSGGKAAAKGKRAGGGSSGFITRMDKNGDGKLSKEEVSVIPALKAGFDGADTNKDGFLDSAEITKMFANYQKKKDAGQ